MKGDRSDGGASISIGFILNMGIAVVFIALIFIVLQGALDQTTASTEAQLEEVGHEVSAMLISADKLATTTSSGGGGTAYFEPPESGLDSYTVVIESGTEGIITIGSGEDQVEIKYQTITMVEPRTGSEIRFTSGNDKVRVVYNSPPCPTTICIG